MQASVQLAAPNQCSERWVPAMGAAQLLSPPWSAEPPSSLTGIYGTGLGRSMNPGMCKHAWQNTDLQSYTRPYGGMTAAPVAATRG